MSKKVPDAVPESKKESSHSSLKIPELKTKSSEAVAEKVSRLSTEKESITEVRKSPRIKPSGKRPADDTGRKSARKGKPKRRKECSKNFPAKIPTDFRPPDDQNLPLGGCF